MMWLSALLGLINPVSRIVGQIADAREAEQNATTARAKIEAVERTAALEARKDILVAQTASPGWWIAPSIRFMFAFPFTVYFGKVILWDKTLDWGSTPDLSANQWNLAMIILGFYFLQEIVGRVVRR